MPAPAMKAAKPRRERVLGPMDGAAMASTGEVMARSVRPPARPPTLEPAGRSGPVAGREVALDGRHLGGETALVPGAVVDLDDDADARRRLADGVDAPTDERHDLVPV